ncbi:DUF1622 domain-containing protein [Nocardia sp. SYP-A9097]|uniref:DUF1622 domain-containing protein n=1 Tax=Nocardia sp. SYP-A9097 TaxID=2663237 RepID=UPI00129A1735|nr:DUF1622 domain-containing protein [Nocardia sp. SYP-A9097]MRH86767.1 DUF1622 domain-containing protein [Nocardia sp. SYP-A9097]
MSFAVVVEGAGRSIDALGVAVIVAGTAATSLAAVPRFYARVPGTYRWLRVRIGSTILLGLELLVGADIIRTVAATPTLGSVAVLAAIVGIRTVLSFSLGRELDSVRTSARGTDLTRDSGE